MANERARCLRRNLTEAERRLWSIVRDRRLAGWKFRRQCPVGPFIVDFACVERLLVIEADGGQHAENLGDLKRSEWLEARGWRVLRFWNHDILGHIEGVRAVILQVLEDG